VTARRKAAAAAYDVVIAGAGMVGSLAACALGDSTLKVALIGPQPATDMPRADYDLRVSALTLATQTMLEALGAWSGVARRRFAPVQSMRVWQGPAPSWDSPGDVFTPAQRRGHMSSASTNAPPNLPQAGEGGEPGPRSSDFVRSGEIEFDAAEIGEPCLAYIVENGVILAALSERLHQFTNVHVIESSVTDFTIDELVQATLADGRQLSTRLLIGADGADSAVRRRLDIPVRRFDMKQQGIVATVRTECAHDDTAWQIFLPTGPLAFLPLPEPDACSIVWSADRQRAQALLQLDDAGFTATLAEAFGGRLGSIRSVGARAAFPLALAHAEHYVRSRAALIGDAAHTVHPLAGQGVNLGFLDAAALAEVLRAAENERRDIGALHVLRRYERWRKGDNLAMIGVTGGFKFLFGNGWPFMSGLRGAGLTVTNRIAPVKNLIMRRASGLVGDLPALARRFAEGTVR
jgi:2-polyprenylphenol 6-hydroxylase